MTEVVHKAMTKWWLISDEDVQVIKLALMAEEHDDNDYNCPSDWTVTKSKCSACKGRRMRADALHTLDSGLQLTDAVPSDWLGVSDG